MSAISEFVSVPIDGMLFRSLLPRNQQIHVPDSSRQRRQRDGLTGLKLVSHLALTSLLFLALVVAVWVTSWVFHSLHSVYPFPDKLFHFLDRLEIWLVYADGGLICATLLNGVWHYVLGVLRGHP